MNTDSNYQVIRKYICEGCGQEVTVSKTIAMFGPYKGEWVEGEIGCCCNLLKKMKKEQNEAKRSRLKHVFEENSLINTSLKNATFDNFESNEFSKQCDIAIKYAETFDLSHPKSLLFQGTFGTGKSHLSVSIAKRVIERGFTAIFISTPKMLTKIRNTYNKQSEFSEDQITHSIIAADLVIFDDIGAEGDISGWGMQKMFEVIDGRSGKHNIYTTNLSSNEFNKTKDMQRIFSRMMMNSVPVVMNGADYRRKQFAKGI